eukprot:1368127-Amorphochlora_amoeboformis.AAC.1
MDIKTTNSRFKSYSLGISISKALRGAWRPEREDLQHLLFWPPSACALTASINSVAIVGSIISTYRCRTSRRWMKKILRILERYHKKEYPKI